MDLLVAGLGALLLTGSLALALGRHARIALAVATLGCVAGAALILTTAVAALRGGEAVLARTLAVPGGALALGADPLSGLFLLLLGVLAVPAALFGAGYLWAHGRRASLGAAGFFFNALVTAIAVVVTARNGLLLLAAWETMTLASYFLVVLDHERAEVRTAGQRYLQASALSGACLLALVAYLGSGPRGLDFAGMAQVAADAGLFVQAGLFGLAVAAFGTKAGLWPMHVWLPLAHPAAPSHVSALMSGCLIECGFYGILRVLSWLPQAPAGFGLALLVAGSVTAVFGITLALGQRDLKRALAFSSIENMGVVALGLGLTLLGAAHGERVVAAVAASGALLHLLNHTVMKGLLFLAAGSVLHGTHTRDLERLGGLLRRMPKTATAFLIGSVSIAALPPLCGFLGEWLILAAGITAATRLPQPWPAAAVLACLALVVAGGLAAAAFVRLASIALLGEPRSPEAALAKDPGWLLTWPLLALAAGCVLLGLAPERALALLAPAVEAVVRQPLTSEAQALLGSTGLLARMAAILLGATAILLAMRGLLRRGSVPAHAATWGCGFTRPSPRLQYTAAGFAQPLVRLLAAVLAPRYTEHAPSSTLPGPVHVTTQVHDRSERGWATLFAGVARRLAVVRGFQSGKLSHYLVLIVGTLVTGLLYAMLTGSPHPR